MGGRTSGRSSRRTRGDFVRVRGDKQSCGLRASAMVAGNGVETRPKSGEAATAAGSGKEEGREAGSCDGGVQLRDGETGRED
jgi:hypothetical protein